MRLAFTEGERRKIGERINRLRKRKMLEPGQLAALMGLSTPTLTGAEKGTGALTPATLRKMALYDPTLLSGIVDPDALKNPAANRVNSVQG